MATGISASDEAVNLFNQDFKIGRKFRYLVFTIEDKKRIVCNKQSAKDATWDDFVGEIDENKCCWAVFDLEYKTPDGRDTDKILFISWVPDTAPVREKMMYAGSSEALKGSFVGIGTSLQATDLSELDLDTCILPAVNKV